MDTTKKSLKFIDLFAGCGGLSLGLEQAGFEPVFVNEINKDALDTYQFNRKDSFPNLSENPFYCHDVKDLVLKPGFLDTVKSALYSVHGIDVCKVDSDLDLLVGGPPCQGYSGIGIRRSYSVDKEQLPSNHLYEDMAFLISKFRPKMFLFENVRGLLNSKWTSSGEKGEIWKDVQRTFDDLPGYSVRAELILSKNYGVPQNRPRVLLVGIRNDLGFEFANGNCIAGGLLPNPENYSVSPPDLQDLLSDLIDPNYENGAATTRYPNAPLTEMQMKLRTDQAGHVIGQGGPLTEHEYSKHSPHVTRKFDHMIKNNGEIPAEYQTKKFSQKILRSTWPQGGPNITVTSLPDDYVHWAQPRSLTVREWARIQTFPDWYQFMGKRTTGGIRRAGNPRESIHFREVPKYTQIGNAVPVQLGKIIGEHFAGILKK